jgi:hypothetical protein
VTNEVLGKFVRVVREIESRRGPFVLFGLFLREDTPEVWDVVASAPWLDAARLDGIRHLAAEIGSALRPEEMLQLSRIVPMETSDPAVVQLTTRLGLRNAPVEMTDIDFAGARIQAATVLSVHGHPESPSAVIPLADA